MHTVSKSRCGAASLLFVATVLFSGSAAFADKPKVEACQLVPAAEVEAIIGKLRGAPKSSTGIQNEAVCDYENTDGSWLKISIYSSDRWGMQKGTVSEMNPTNIPGLGEEAFWVKRGSTTELYARKGANIVEVDSTITGGNAINKKVAEKVLAKLK